MGFNTAIVLLNDATGDIRGDSALGESLMAAIDATILSGPHRNHPVSVPAGNHGNAMAVLAPHHSSVTQVVAIGGNTIRPIAQVYSSWSVLTKDGEDPMVGLLRDVAGQYGYRLVKKSTK